MVVWRGRRLGCMGGGVVADMRILFANFAPESNYFTIYEHKNIMDVIT